MFCLVYSHVVFKVRFPHLGSTDLIFKSTLLLTTTT